MPKVKYVKQEDPTHHCWLEKILRDDDISGDRINQDVMGRFCREYIDEQRCHTKLNPFQKMLKGVETFVRHEVHEVAPESFPQLDTIKFRTEYPIEEPYVRQAFKNACIEGIKNTEAEAERWNNRKEIANMWAPVPLGLAAFGAGVLFGADGIGWAAAAEFGPYLALPPAFWLKSREHKLRREIEELEKAGNMNGELEEKRSAMERYNTMKDVCSFYFPVVFDGSLTGLSYSHAIPTPAAYMTGIVLVPYIAHGAGFFFMLKEHAAEEKEAVLRKMMDTPVEVVGYESGSREISARLQRL